MDWIERLAVELGVDPLSDAEVITLLGSAHDVAHRVERRTTPLAAFVLGAAVRARTDAGAAREVAFAEAIATLRELLPPAEVQP